MIHLQVTQSATVSSLQHLLCHQAAIVLVRKFAMEAEELTQLPFHPSGSIAKEQRTHTARIRDLVLRLFPLYCLDRNRDLFLDTTSRGLKRIPFEIVHVITWLLCPLALGNRQKTIGGSLICDLASCFRNFSSFSESLESAPAIHSEDSPISSVRSHEDFRLRPASESWNLLATRFSPTVKTIPDDVCSSFDPVCAASKDDEKDLRIDRMRSLACLVDGRKTRDFGYSTKLVGKRVSGLMLCLHVIVRIFAEAARRKNRSRTSPTSSLRVSDELFSNVVMLQDSHRLRGLGFKAATKPKVIETSQMETISTADLSLSTRARTDSTDDVVTSAVAPSDIAQILLAADADVDVEPNGDVKSSGVDVDVISVSSTVGPSIISNGFSTAHVSRFDTVRFITNLELRQNRPSSTSNVDNVRLLRDLVNVTVSNCTVNSNEMDPVLVVRGSINTAY
ncbi:hypothetical protein ALC60_10001 [Trachymyrmex zeteki]|uniref:Uncharacterized protein n=1 Tax=Mycetomoellerius zeteki TaxID=64791 RepID=A0A151WSG6_9HYME|nr:hypothetical protein ALC60_10001 [Trachymyrmex zeteki]